ncbi:hypothetical protein MVES1_003069 [Malassezia vespertilionis]|uniref:Uncharacterized protein n=1 Tax=Malassezia vespertilionis TaxID=2020962 RepID=A0A2N1J9A1_9BASI|nr:uncharacterized protein MVES1_003069 [Malassezia vespertilionis]PKI83135.1 hypothetical protein MVES_002910 [Malassezia vespertilionis]WFD07699.1 hypothetical protein MVES1_003069 [Malassezia vespertilionis]
MPPWNDALVTRQATTHTTASDVSDAANTWLSAEVKYEEKRWAEQSEKALQTDPEFLRYQAGVERALARFESVSEWADFISFLLRLLKALQAMPKFNAIPHKLIVAKRLSQCLNPALPSGVHTRALDVYEYIFSVIGVDGLRRDLPVWSPGLLPFFQNAATSVRPALLTVFNKYYIPLHMDLRPLTRALLLALLPCLEDESSESFDRVESLLHQIANSVGQAFFLQTMWIAQISTPSIRLSALHYLARYMPKLRVLSQEEHEQSLDTDLDDTTQETEDIDFAQGVSLTALNPGLLARAFSHTLGDDSLLVRRNALDFLVQHFPLSSVPFAEEIESADRVLLMDAAIGAVLRRDISLNRRLYAWLLGADEAEDKQQAYFAKHALQLVKTALLRGMHAYDTDPVMLQRPYRIFVSFLDKSALGQPLLRAMALDVFYALLHNNDLRENHDLYPTAQTLFEAVDTYILYQQLFSAMRAELEHRPNAVVEQHGSAVQLLDRMLHTFGLHDEETRTVHLPILYLALAEILRQGLAKKSIMQDKAMDILRLFDVIHSNLDPHAFVQSGANNDAALGAAATAVYEEGHALEAASTLQSRRQCTALVRALMDVGLHNAPAMEQDAISVQCFLLVLRILHSLDAARAEAYVDLANNTLEAESLDDTLDVAGWNKSVFEYLANPPTFEAYALLLGIALHMTNSALIPGKFTFANAADFEAIFHPLLTALQPEHCANHVEAAELYWVLKEQVPSDFATDILCAQLSDPNTRAQTMSVVGTLWQRSNKMTRAKQLARPLFLILDALCSKDRQERNAGFTWLRIYLGSFDTLLVMLMDKVMETKAKRNSTTIAMASQEVVVYRYEAPFDQDLLNYYLAIVSALFAEGKQQIFDATRKIPYEAKGENGKGTFIASSGSFLDVLKDVLFFLLHAAHPKEQVLWYPANAATQCIALDLFHYLILYGQQDPTWLSNIQAKLIDVMLVVMHRQDESAQIAALSTLLEAVQTRCASAQSGGVLDDETSALFAEIVRRGVTSAPSCTTFLVWIDFAHNMLSYTREAVNEFILPLCVALCDLLSHSLTALVKTTLAFSTKASSEVQRIPSTEQEIVHMVRLLEHALHQAMSSRHMVDLERALDTEPAQSLGLLGNISSVFASDSPTPSVSSMQTNTPIHPVLRTTALAIQTLEYAWTSGRGPKPRLHFPDAHAQTTLTLRQLYRLRMASVTEAVVANWWKRSWDAQEPVSSIVMSETIALLECLAESPQVIVSSLCDIITMHVSPSGSDRKRGTGGAVLVSDAVLFRFLEMFLQSRDGETVVHIWPVLALLAKNVMTTNAANKNLMYHTLRIVTSAAVTLSLTRAFEERRTKRDIQDTFVRVCEMVVSLYSRALDVTSSLHRGKDSEACSTHGADDISADPSAVPLSTTVVSFFAATAVPALATLAIDLDKTAALCTSLVYYIVTPSLRARARTLEIPDLVLDLLKSITRVPGTLKTWRSLVVDVFYDAKFFSLAPQEGEQWTAIFTALYTVDRERLEDVISRIANAPSANLFVSRENDLIARITGIRRLSYSIYAGEKNAYLAQLPLMQEKVVDILRSNAPDLVQAEIYLCMRVLLCRFSSQHLVGFWPIILTELLRIFGNARTELLGDNSDALLLLFSVSKLVDYLLTLQTEDFQVHQWLLITDTPDAVNPLPGWMADSLLDCIGKLAAKTRRLSAQHYRTSNTSSLCRPMLQMSRAESIEVLEPFFLNASAVFYDNQYCRTQVDWENIDQGLLRDLFEPIVPKL